MSTALHIHRTPLRTTTATTGSLADQYASPNGLMTPPPSQSPPSTEERVSSITSQARIQPGPASKRSRADSMERLRINPLLAHEHANDMSPNPRHRKSIRQIHIPSRRSASPTSSDDTPDSPRSGLVSLADPPPSRSTPRRRSTSPSKSQSVYAAPVPGIGLSPFKSILSQPEVRQKHLQVTHFQRPRYSSAEPGDRLGQAVSFSPTKIRSRELPFAKIAGNDESDNSHSGSALLESAAPAQAADDSNSTANGSPSKLKSRKAGRKTTTATSRSRASNAASTAVGRQGKRLSQRATLGRTNSWAEFSTPPPARGMRVTKEIAQPESPSDDPLLLYASHYAEWDYGAGSPSFARSRLLPDVTLANWNARHEIGTMTEIANDQELDGDDEQRSEGGAQGSPAGSGSTLLRTRSMFDGVNFGPDENDEDMFWQPGHVDEGDDDEASHLDYSQSANVFQQPSSPSPRAGSALSQQSHVEASVEDEVAQELADISLANKSDDMSDEQDREHSEMLEDEPEAQESMSQHGEDGTPDGLAEASYSQFLSRSERTDADRRADSYRSEADTVERSGDTEGHDGSRSQLDSGMTSTSSQRTHQDESSRQDSITRDTEGDQGEGDFDDSRASDLSVSGLTRGEHDDDDDDDESEEHLEHDASVSASHSISGLRPDISGQASTVDDNGDLSGSRDSPNQTLSEATDASRTGDYSHPSRSFDEGPSVSADAQESLEQDSQQRDEHANDDEEEDDDGEMADEDSMSDVEVEQSLVASSEERHSVEDPLEDLDIQDESQEHEHEHEREFDPVHTDDISNQQLQTEDVVEEGDVEEEQKDTQMGERHEEEDSDGGSIASVEHPPERHLPEARRRSFPSNGVEASSMAAYSGIPPLIAPAITVGSSSDLDQNSPTRQTQDRTTGGSPGSFQRANSSASLLLMKSSAQPVIQISSLDPRAAAKAAAILKLHYQYVEEGFSHEELDAAELKRYGLSVRDIRGLTAARNASDLPNVLADEELRELERQRSRNGRSGRKSAHNSPATQKLDKGKGKTRMIADWSTSSSSSSEGLFSSDGIVSSSGPRTPVPLGSDANSGGSSESLRTPKLPGAWLWTPARLGRAAQVPSKSPRTPLLASATSHKSGGGGSPALDPDPLVWELPEWNALDRVFRTTLREDALRLLEGSEQLAAVSSWPRELMIQAQDDDTVTKKIKAHCIAVLEVDVEAVLKRFVEKYNIQASQLNGMWSSHRFATRIAALQRRYLERVEQHYRPKTVAKSSLELVGIAKAELAEMHQPLSDANKSAERDGVLSLNAAELSLEQAHRHSGAGTTLSVMPNLPEEDSMDFSLFAPLAAASAARNADAVQPLHVQTLHSTPVRRSQRSASHAQASQSGTSPSKQRALAASLKESGTTSASRPGGAKPDLRKAVLQRTFGTNQTEAGETSTIAESGSGRGAGSTSRLSGQNLTPAQRLRVRLANNASR
ncbi:hypothetical protein OC846_005338 [Tilletia horrida]|uniref:Uncharacterized protein n=1 Tax=Tilletia horrida TaxID=155126 RepID=A0AAN6GN50_9BASI|nr:hypothetical protein OC845_004974 [Tilletia horrida]KAK0546275.1 hypothetical protein OC846_005338 [Tilletia horrida]KAK0562942.1 hypothetical protein OC861_005075 [Tilletia horrida]